MENQKAIINKLITEQLGKRPPWYISAIGNLLDEYVQFYYNSYARTFPPAPKYAALYKLIDSRVSPYMNNIGRGAVEGNDISVKKATELIKTVFMREEKKVILELIDKHRSFGDSYIEALKKRCGVGIKCNKSIPLNVRSFDCNNLQCTLDDYDRFLLAKKNALLGDKYVSESGNKDIQFGHYLELEEQINSNAERFKSAIKLQFNLPEQVYEEVEKEAEEKRRSRGIPIFGTIIGLVIVLLILVIAFFAVRYFLIQYKGYDILTWFGIHWEKAENPFKPYKYNSF